MEISIVSGVFCINKYIILASCLADSVNWVLIFLFWGVRLSIAYNYGTLDSVNPGLIISYQQCGLRSIGCSWAEPRIVGVGCSRWFLRRVVWWLCQQCCDVTRHWLQSYQHSVVGETLMGTHWHWLTVWPVWHSLDTNSDNVTAPARDW